MLAFVIFGILAVIISALWYSIAFEASLQSRQLVEDHQALAFADFSLALYSALDPNRIDHNLSGGRAPDAADLTKVAFSSEDFAFRNMRVDLDNLGLTDDCDGAAENPAATSRAGLARADVLDASGSVTRGNAAWVQQERAGAGGLSGDLLPKGGRMVYDEKSSRTRQGRVSGVSISTYEDALEEFEGTLFGSSDPASDYYFYRPTDSCVMEWQVVFGQAIDTSADVDDVRENWENRILVEAKQNVTIGVLEARRRIGSASALSSDGIRLRAWIGCDNQDTIDDMNDGTITNTAHSNAAYSRMGVGQRDTQNICSHTRPDNPMAIVVWAEGSTSDDIGGLSDGAVLASLNRVFPALSRRFVRFGPLEIQRSSGGARTLMMGGEPLPNQADLYEALDVAGSRVRQGATETIRALAFYGVAPLPLPAEVSGSTTLSWFADSDDPAAQPATGTDDLLLPSAFSIERDCDGASSASFADRNAGYTSTGTLTGTPAAGDETTRVCYREQPTRGFGTVPVSERISATTFRIVDPHSDQTRTWFYIPSWENSGTGTAGDPTTIPLTLELVDAVAPAGGFTFNIVPQALHLGGAPVSIARLPDSQDNVNTLFEATFGGRGFTTMTIPAGASRATFNLNIQTDPGSAGIQYEPRLPDGSTINLIAQQPDVGGRLRLFFDDRGRGSHETDGTDLGFYPATFTMRPGDDSQVGVYNISDSALTSQALNAMTATLPRGMSLRYSVERPEGVTADYTGVANHPFTVPAMPATSSVNLWISADHATPPGTYTFDSSTLDLDDPLVIEVEEHPVWSLVSEFADRSDPDNIVLIPRVEPFVYPYELVYAPGGVEDPDDRTNMVSFNVLLELPQRPSRDLVYDITVTPDSGLPMDVIESFPATVTAPANNTGAMIPVVIDPSELTGYYGSTNFRASRAAGFTLKATLRDTDYSSLAPGGVDEVRVILVDDEITAAPADPRVSIYPQTVNVEQGGTAFFIVSNTHDTATFTEDLYAALGTNLPAGVNLYFNALDTSGAADVSGGGRFRIALPDTDGDGTSESGEDILVLVEATSAAAVGRTQFTTDDATSPTPLQRGYLFSLANATDTETTSDRVLLLGDSNNNFGAFAIEVFAPGNLPATTTSLTSR
ncbi:MAG: hypothetical protein MPJ52_00930 [Alphaproteobacteria bacterium]|nr:hypothetical protein [Alphaproteobacteria bacterium]MDA7986971.1 hypothetical protein [Alphaproteobacteria bacterium]